MDFHGRSGKFKKSIKSYVNIHLLLRAYPSIDNIQSLRSTSHFHLVGNLCAKTISVHWLFTTVSTDTADQLSHRAGEIYEHFMQTDTTTDDFTLDLLGFMRSLLPSAETFIHSQCLAVRSAL
ncbi:hypothetical protein J6590_055555 [Homalodisca vitripennis]|nr:hypothetical protein J6590_055555 [Homalodisca vitripennis]